jgi:hypothetical protein
MSCYALLVGFSSEVQGLGSGQKGKYIVMLNWFRMCDVREKESFRTSCAFIMELSLFLARFEKVRPRGPFGTARFSE